MYAGPNVVEVDLAAACPETGKEYPVRGNFLSIEQCPPGVDASIVFGANPDADRMKVRPGLSIGFLGREREDKPDRLFIRWTAIEVSPTPRDELRYLRLVWSEDSPANPSPERLGVYATPALDFTPGQAVLAGSAIQLPNVECEELEITASSANTGPIAVGKSTVTAAVDGTGNGTLINPGMSKTFPVRNASTLYVHGAAGRIFSYTIPHRRR